MAETIRFGVYELDQEAMELRKDGSPIKLQEQPFKVLALLAERPGKIVTREELREQIWGNTFVDFDQSLNKAINRVREALNDNAATPEYVETVPRRGYRFIAPVSAFPANGMSIPPAPATINAIITSEKEARRSWIVPVAAIAVVALLAIIGIATAFRWRQPRSRAGSEAHHILWMAAHAFARWQAACLRFERWRRAIAYLGATDGGRRSDSSDRRPGVR
jgi:DNA-binding winged helix-turn-helix (wHTH) protein